MKHKTKRPKPKLLHDILPEDILSRFLFEPNLVKHDCEALKKQLHRLHRTQIDEDRIAALRSNIRLRAWLIVNEPCMLLLNGRTEPQQGSTISQMSVILFESLLKHQTLQNDNKTSGITIIPLIFFCGEHCDWHGDPNGNPEEAAMSLLLQLIDHYQDEIEPSIVRQCYNQTQPESLASICASFESVIMSLDSKAIVVLILDGLRHFTYPQERREKTRDLISRLVGIYRKSPIATVKILFTSPTRSDFVEDLFDESELLNLPRNIPVSNISTHLAHTEHASSEYSVDYMDGDSEADL